MATNNSINVQTAATGKVLQGAGVGTAPAFSTATYPATATSTGTILRADGTNWVPSTATYPNTAGTSGNVLTSNGTNWVSSTPSGGAGNLAYIAVVLTSAQVKALNASPVTIIPAQGAGTMIIPLNAWAKLRYGTSAFVAGASQTIGLYWRAASDTPVGVNDLCSNGLITNNGAFGDTSGNCSGGTAYNIRSVSNSVSTAFENVPVIALNPVATEISGNAGNDNTLTISVLYYVITI